MKVKVKQGKTGFIYGSLRKEGQPITLKPIESTKLDDNDKPIIISAEDQFSKLWMKKVETPKGKPGPKPKPKEEKQEDS